MAKGKRKNAPQQRASEDMGNGEDASDTSKDLYQILGVERAATQEQIRKAYHKLALRLHPDKNPGDEDAKEKFQTLQNVFSVLGDPEKRAVYDETGSVEDVDLVGESGKSLYEFFRALYKTVTEEDVKAFADSYRGSEQEMADLKKLYTDCKGNMNRVFQMLMCSDPNLDSHRFVEAIDTSIAAGELKETKTYRKWAKGVAKRPAPANPLARVEKGRDASSSDLVTAIQKRGKTKMDSLVSSLEAKYSKKNKKRRKEGGGGNEFVEPSEEEFQAARARIASSKK